MQSRDNRAPSQTPSAPDAREPDWEDESAVFAMPSSQLAAGDALSSGEPESETRASARPPGIDTEPPSAQELAEIFSQYHRYVAKIGRNILGASADVDDLIQDVFLATVRDIHKIREPHKVRGWLATVTTRMARRRRLRTSQRESLAPEDPDEVVELPSEAPSPESSADLSGNIERLLDLPDELRTPWMLKHVEGHTLEDVAARCDCSLSTAQRRIQAAAGRIAKRR